MMKSRIEKGSYVHPPHLGCREFLGLISPVQSTDFVEAANANRSHDPHLGRMPYKIVYGPGDPGKPVDTLWREYTFQPEQGYYQVEFET
jgi:hypothetical protein